MDSRDILKELGEIRGSLVDSADPEKEAGSPDRQGRRPVRRWIVRGLGAAAAVALLVLVVRFSDWQPLATDPASPSKSGITSNEEAKPTLPGGNMHAEGELAWFSERELLMRADLIVRGTVEARETYRQPLKGPMEGEFQTFVILTISVQDVIRGDGAQPGDTIRLAVDELTGYDSALKEAAPGAEGIFRMYETDPWAEALKERAPFAAGDGVRFAVWQKKDTLVYEQAAFTGLQADWTLDQAADYFRSVIGEEAPAVPEDFAVCDDSTLQHEDLETKILSFGSFREMEDYADVIVRVVREKQETPVIVRSGDNIVSGFTFSQVRIEKIHKDKTGRLQAGASIRILENEFYDERSNTVFHVAGYSMMKEGAPYLLFLKRNTYSDGEDYYTAAGVHFGTVSLSADGRTVREYDEAAFGPFWDEAKKKYAAD